MCMIGSDDGARGGEVARDAHRRRTRRVGDELRDVVARAVAQLKAPEPQQDLATRVSDAGPFLRAALLLGAAGGASSAGERREAAEGEAAVRFWLRFLGRVTK